METLRASADTYRLRDLWLDPSAPTPLRIGRDEARRLLAELCREPRNEQALRRALSDDGASQGDVIERATDRIAMGSWQLERVPRSAPVPRTRRELDTWSAAFHINKKGAFLDVDGPGVDGQASITKKGLVVDVKTGDTHTEIDVNEKGVTTNFEVAGTKTQLKVSTSGDVSGSTSFDVGGHRVDLRADQNGVGTTVHDLEIGGNKVDLSMDSRGNIGVHIDGEDGNRLNVRRSENGGIAVGTQVGDDKNGMGIGMSSDGTVQCSATVGGYTVSQGVGADGSLHTTVGNGKHHVELQKIDDTIEAIEDLPETLDDAFDDLGDGDFSGAASGLKDTWDARCWGSGAHQAGG